MNEGFIILILITINMFLVYKYIRQQYKQHKQMKRIKDQLVNDKRPLKWHNIETSFWIQPEHLFKYLCENYFKQDPQTKRKDYSKVDPQAKCSLILIDDTNGNQIAIYDTIGSTKYYLAQWLNVHYRVEIEGEKRWKINNPSRFRLSAVIWVDPPQLPILWDQIQWPLDFDPQAIPQAIPTSNLWFWQRPKIYAKPDPREVEALAEILADEKLLTMRLNPKSTKDMQL